MGGDGIGNPIREPITQLKLDPMPLKLREEMKN